MWKRAPVILGITSLLLACGGAPGSHSRNALDSGAHYAAAQKWAEAGDAVEALRSLEASFEGGLSSPMGVVTDERLSSLVADPLTRPSVRELLSRYVRESEAMLVTAKEPGDQIIVEGVIVDELSGAPISGAVVELVHTDRNGKYFSEDGTWNPRLFGYLKTADDGTFRVTTIKPGGYEDEEGVDVPTHIHFSIEATGYRAYGSEFLFDDDPMLIADALHQAGLERLRVAKRQAGSGVPAYLVTIPLQPLTN